MTIPAFLVLGLAVWRLSSLLVSEEGPFDIFPRIRNLVGVRYTERSTPIGNNELAQLFTCVWCMSVWVAVGAGVCYWLWPGPTLAVATVLALSAVAIIVDRATGG